MKRSLTILLLGISAIICRAEWQPVFNGKNLDGWSGDPRLWKVEDGVLVGETNDSDKKTAANTFLIWQGGEVGDFTLEFKARVTGNNNSGVQYRSCVIDAAKWSIGGYQMDLHPKQEYLGMLYEERGRGIACQRGQKVMLAGKKPEVTGQFPVAKVDLSQWNDFRIVAKGPLLQHYVNGELAAEINDTDEKNRQLKGLLALQLHAGPPMRAEFKEIRLIRHAASGQETKAGAAVPGVKIKEGFQLSKVYAIPKEQGSWVAMTTDDKGRLICGDQFGKLYRVTLAEELAVEELPLQIGGAHGLLWHKGVLYVSVNEGAGRRPSGVYRVTDNDDDGEVETIEPILALRGSGEHGPHSLIPSPDGEWIYFVAGNHTDLPKINSAFVPPVWAEDQLLKRNPDARGHANGRMAPGGWIARCRPDGSDWQLVSIGYRNAFDIAFDHHGELLTYDADMEWDFGMPWYRPTRMCHALPGSEFGWRNGTGKWPAYSEDSMPSLIDIGPGSPTGLLAGKGAKFPAEYQKAVFAFDWTFATVYAVHLRKDGVALRAEKEEFLSGSGLPLTDATIGADGAMYFLTGGRRTASALWKVTYTGDADTLPVAYATTLPPMMDEKAATAGLSSADRVTRQAARVAIEQKLGANPNPNLGALATTDWSKICVAIIQARHQKPVDAFAILSGMDWKKLNTEQQIAWLRAAGLVFIRSKTPDPAWRNRVLAMIDSSFPATDDTLNRELCRMLSYLQAQGIVGRTLALMDSAPPEAPPAWAELAKRNAGYGKTIANMLANQPPTQVIHYVYCLRCVNGPWRPEERQRFFAWIDRLSKLSGGASYGGFLNALRKDAIELATREEKDIIAKLPPPDTHNPFANLPKIEGPGRAWTVSEVVKTVSTPAPRDPARGERMFHGALCSACHSFGGKGGAAGPDLTTVGGRFTAEELAVAILEPSKVVSDQYQFEQFIFGNGSQILGRIVDEKDGKLMIATNPYDFSQTTSVEASEVKERKPSPVSPMPAGLIHSMNPDELRDLFAYLLGK